MKKEIEKVNRLEDIKASDIGRKIPILFEGESFPHEGHLKEIVEYGGDKRKAYRFLIQTKKMGITKITPYSIFNAEIDNGKLIPSFYGVGNSTVEEFILEHKEMFPKAFEQFQKDMKIIKGEIN